ncbi:hypothetical protein HP532_21775 [Pseudomonas sp. CrR25]|nr:hypothetical protein [Pseudomonas sp. CrR25]
MLRLPGQKQYRQGMIGFESQEEWIGTVVVAFVIAGALVTAGVPAAIVSGLLVLLRLAQLSWAWLASILGAGAVAGTLSAG